MNKLKILAVSQNYFLRGGSDRMFFLTARLLEEHGHKVIPFTAANPDNQASEWSDYFPVATDFEKPGPIDLLRFIYSRPAAKAISKLLEKQNFDIAHLHIYYGKLTSSILAPLKSAGIPIIQTLHDYKLICPVYTLVSNDRICEACQGQHFWRALPRRCNRNSLARTSLSIIESYVSKWLGANCGIDQFITVSDFMRQKMIDHGVPSHKISTVHNFVDTSWIIPNTQIGNYLLYVGRLERIKGVFTLLEAAASLREITLLFAGDGTARAEMMEVIERKQLDNVMLLGFRKERELKELIKGSICTIIPSIWYEPLGITILESYILGRPVIGSRVGGIPEIISNEVDGFLVQPGDVIALRGKMAWMADHPKEAAVMGLAGQKKVKEHFNPKIYYNKLMSVYRQVL